MFSESRYKIPLLTGIRRKWLAILVAFAVPVLTLAALSSLMPEICPMLVKTGIWLGLGFAGLLGLLLFVSGSIVVVGPSRLSKFGILRKAQYVDFDTVTAILTAPSSGDVVTRVLTEDPFESHSSLLAEMGTSLLVFLSGIRSVPTIFNMTISRRAGITISSCTERYAELVAEIIRQCPGAFVDPFTRIVADLGSLAPAHAYPAVLPNRQIRATPDRDLDAAKKYLARFELDKAGELLRKLPADSHTETYRLLGLIELLKRRPQQAMEFLDKAACQSPNDPHIRFLLGLAYYCAGGSDMAYSELKRSSEIKGLEPGQMAFLGCAAARTQDWDEALRAFQMLERKGWNPFTAGLASQCTRCTKALGGIVETLEDPQRRERERWRHYLLVALGVVSFFLWHVAGDRGWIAFPVALVLTLIVELIRRRVESRVSRADLEEYPACLLEMGWTSQHRNTAELAAQDEKT